jgi:hypothetical protein
VHVGLRLSRVQRQPGLPTPGVGHPAETVSFASTVLWFCSTVTTNTADVELLIDIYLNARCCKSYVETCERSWSVTSESPFCYPCR